MLPHHQVQVFMPTSVAPWHPSADITLATIEDVWEVLQHKATINVYCDGLHPKATKEEADAYRAYKNTLYTRNHVRVIESDSWIGLVGLFRMFIAGIDRPLVMNVQHDWEFITPDKIDIEALCQTMLDHVEVQVVRFHKRNLPQSRRHVDRKYHEVDKYAVPLVATDGWGDSPHIARADHYQDYVHTFMSQQCSDDGRYGIEGPLWRAYQKEIKRYGFELSQERWGSFLYGKFGENELVRHRGRDATRWRKQRGMSRKCLADK